MLRVVRCIVGIMAGVVFFICMPYQIDASEEKQLCPICIVANNEQAGYAEKATSTLTRGALNLGLGWTEIIRGPAEEVEEGGNVFVGIAKGIGRGFGRTAAGLGEVLTFWTPKIRDQYVHFAEDCPLDTK